MYRCAVFATLAIATIGARCTYDPLVYESGLMAMVVCEDTTRYEPGVEIGTFASVAYPTGLGSEIDITAPAQVTVTAATFTIDNEGWFECSTPSLGVMSAGCSCSNSGPIACTKVRPTTLYAGVLSGSFNSSMESCSVGTAQICAVMNVTSTSLYKMFSLGKPAESVSLTVGVGNATVSKTGVSPRGVAVPNGLWITNIGLMSNPTNPGSWGARYVAISDDSAVLTNDVETVPGGNCGWTGAGGAVSFGMGPMSSIVSIVPGSTCMDIQLAIAKQYSGIGGSPSEDFALSGTDLRVTPSLPSDYSLWVRHERLFPITTVSVRIQDVETGTLVASKSGLVSYSCNGKEVLSNVRSGPFHAGECETLCVDLPRQCERKVISFIRLGETLKAAAPETKSKIQEKAVWTTLWVSVSWVSTGVLIAYFRLKHFRVSSSGSNRLHDRWINGSGYMAMLADVLLWPLILLVALCSVLWYRRQEAKLLKHSANIKIAQGGKPSVSVGKSVV